MRRNDRPDDPVVNRLVPVHENDAEPFDAVCVANAEDRRFFDAAYLRGRFRQRHQVPKHGVSQHRIAFVSGLVRSCGVAVNGVYALQYANEALADFFVHR